MDFESNGAPPNFNGALVQATVQEAESRSQNPEARSQSPESTDAAPGYSEF
jgi:hypothetical protein